MSTATDSITVEKIKVKDDLPLPKLYRVIYMNDDVTTVQFVIMTLLEIFNYTEDRAAEVTEKIHVEGSAVVAILPFELAEQKGIEVTLLARNNNFPLMVKFEPAE
jgi:ATP-dependent Clp protease adaptor protein ClpS